MAKGMFRIAELAKSQGHTVDSLARVSGVKFTTLQTLWANRTRNPTFGTLRAIAQSLHVPVEDLIDPNYVPTDPNKKRTPDLQPI